MQWQRKKVGEHATPMDNDLTVQKTTIGNALIKVASAPLRLPWHDDI